MSRKYSFKKEAIYKDIDRLATLHGFSFEQLDEMAGYSGPNSIRNIVRQGSHNLDATRLSLLLSELSRVDNLFLHKHVLDSTKYHIVPVTEVAQADGSLSEIHHELTRQMYIGEDALLVGNLERVYHYIAFLKKVIAKVTAELQSKMVMMSGESEIEQVLMGEKKTDPGVVGSRIHEKHNVPKGKMCENLQDRENREAGQ